ncbi:hypothetical protein G3T14_05065 [Methylobacterium sp. BTF04]|uniref:hypothetical protein n=1 Tax=Methylobacterium sp. BTF04 TaxID=2708300 RepID=UPI0013D06F60|nr:hypothetical protein [Methylobacterium sp. BTF04]NEU11497.1 hypothetical protein [Methylobacterium sp. BTF04]
MTPTPTPPASAATDTDAALPVAIHEASVHDSLLETVSTEVLLSQDDGAAEALPDTVPDLNAISEPAPLMVEAAAPEAENMPEPTAATLPSHVANDVEPTVVASVEALPIPMVVPMRPAPVPPFRRPSAIDALSELSQTNGTVVAFLRNEGTATLAHWRSLAAAKTPADAVRLQVDEMQRAADASLTCLNTLARRAGRFAGILIPR